MSTHRSAARTAPNPADRQELPAVTTANRNAEIHAFYTTHAAQLINAVRRTAFADDSTIEDACQTAWTTLVRRPDITLDRSGFAWLRTVATHAAWGLTRQAIDEKPAGDFHGPGDATDGQMAEPISRDPRSAEDHALARTEHTERVAMLHTLKPRERQALTLQGLGYTYNEISKLMGATYTATNRRINDGRAKLRDLPD